MRIQAFRVWFSSALQQGVGAARRAGMAISRGIRRAAAKIEAGVGVGDDESSFGQSGSRAWMQMLDEARARLLQLFEKSYFERFPRFEKFVRRVLGRPAALKKEAPKLAAPKPKGPTGPLGAHKPRVSDEAARLRREVQLGMMRAHQSEHAGLRETVEAHRRGAIAGDEEHEHRRDRDRDRNDDRDPDDAEEKTEETKSYS